MITVNNRKQYIGFGCGTNGSQPNGLSSIGSEVELILLTSFDCRTRSNSIKVSSFEFDFRMFDSLYRRSRSRDFHFLATIIFEGPFSPKTQRAPDMIYPRITKLQKLENLRKPFRIFFVKIYPSINLCGPDLNAFSTYHFTILS